MFSRRIDTKSEPTFKVYGDAQAHLHVDTTNYVTEREMFGDFGLGKCFFEPPLEDEVNFEVTPHNDLFKVNTLIDSFKSYIKLLFFYSILRT